MTPNKEDTILGAEGFPPWKPEQPQWQEGFGRSHLIPQTGGPLGMQTENGLHGAQTSHASGELTVSWAADKGRA